MTTPTTSDSRTLVEAVQAGDRDAFGVIYKRYHDTVFRFAYRRMNGNRTLAEDITAETFLRALKRIDRFTWTGADVGAWLIVIARNIIIDHFKRHYVWREDVKLDESGTRDPDTDRTIDPVKMAENNSLAIALNHLMCTNLSDDQRTVIVLRYFADMSVTETATVMRRNENAVKSLHWRALQRLRQAVQIPAQSAYGEHRIHRHPCPTDADHTHPCNKPDCSRSDA